MLRRILAPVCMLVSLTACAAVGPEDESSEGESFQAEWWTWVASEPTPTNPVVDRTGVFCDRNQPTDVWFLAGTFGSDVQRECVVPSGRPIIAPLVNLISGSDEECDAFMGDATGEAFFDGVQIAPERLEGELISYQAAKGNPVTEEIGRFDAIACGLWMRVAPPAVGPHELTIYGQSGDFTVDVSYVLEVVDLER